MLLKIITAVNLIYGTEHRHPVIRPCQCRVGGDDAFILVILLGIGFENQRHHFVIADARSEILEMVFILADMKELMRNGKKQVVPAGLSGDVICDKAFRITHIDMNIGAVNPVRYRFAEVGIFAFELFDHEFYTVFGNPNELMFCKILV